VLKLKLEAPFAVLAMAFYALLGIYFFTGLYCSDDTRYMIGAIKVALGEPISVASLAERRAMFLLPGSLLYQAGRSLEWMIVPYTALFVVLGLAGYCLARQFLGRTAAVASAALAAAQPVFFLYAGAMLPDLSSTLFLMVGLLYLCLWMKAVSTAQHRSAGYALLLGMAMAMSFTIKESGIVLMPVVAGMMIAAGAKAGAARLLRDVLVASSGFLLLLALEALLFRSVAGQWYSSVGSLLVPHDLAGFVEAQGHGVLDRLHTLRLELGTHTTLLFTLAGMSSLHLVARWWRGKMSRAEALTWTALVAFWLWPLLYFTFGSASLKTYLLPVMQQRYYAPSVLPAAILAIHLGVSLIRYVRLIMPAWVPAMVLGVTLVCLLSAPYLLRRDRGLIYGAQAKEAFIQARNDARKRYPGIPFRDVQSGWTTDLNRCRALLMPLREDGSNRLLEALDAGRDKAGKDFGYQPITSASLPVLVAGHGAYMGSPSQFHWVADLQRGVAAGEFKVTLVGRYGRVKRQMLRGKLWMPRTAAVGVAEAESLPLDAEEAPAPLDLQEVKMYLIETARR